VAAVTAVPANLSRTGQLETLGSGPFRLQFHFLQFHFLDLEFFLFSEDH
jgi:hypothetical protein